MGNLLKTKNFLSARRLSSWPWQAGKLKPNKQGFTLIELLIVIGVIAVLMTVAIVAINPARQFAKANNAVRQHDLKQIGNAVQQNIIDNKGPFLCAAGSLPTDNTTCMGDPAQSPTAECAAYYDICDCLVPSYLPVMPVDPQYGYYNNDCGDYNSQYTIQSASLILGAPYAQLVAEFGEISITFPGAITVQGGCLTGYPDGDGDGYYSDTSEQVCAETLPPGYSANPGTDCCDADVNVNTGQTGWFTTQNSCGNYDYNCVNGEELKEIIVTTCSISCSGGGQNCVTGWVGSAPSCGSSRDHRVCAFWDTAGCTGANWGNRTGWGELCSGFFFINIYDINNTQACR